MPMHNFQNLMTPVTSFAPCLLCADIDPAVERRVSSEAPTIRLSSSGCWWAPRESNSAPTDYETRSGFHGSRRYTSIHLRSPTETDGVRRHPQAEKRQSSGLPLLGEG